MSTSTSNEDGDHGFQIAPMVDIVFVLLMFFMTMQTVKEFYVEATPSGRPNTPDTFAPLPVILDIATDETVSINGKIVAVPADIQFAELARWLAGIRSTSPKDECFVIRASDDTRHERVVRVLAALNKAGFKRISFA
jgi:biopolymer transport protein ExbD